MCTYDNFSQLYLTMLECTVIWQRTLHVFQRRDEWSVRVLIMTTSSRSSVCRTSILHMIIVYVCPPTHTNSCQVVRSVLI